MYIYIYVYIHLHIHTYTYMYTLPYIIIYIHIHTKSLFSSLVCSLLSLNYVTASEIYQLRKPPQIRNN